MKKYYAFIEKDGSIGIGSKSSRPDNAVCVVPYNLADKKIKLIDQPLLNPDGTEQTDLEGNVITEKVAVLDEVAQAEYESRQLSQQQEQAVVNAVTGAISFGNQLMTNFIVENVKLGITTDNMTEPVLEALKDVMPALQAGSLYLAIQRIKAIPEANKDAKYITDTRLLKAVNDIEKYLNITLSVNL